MANLNQYFLQSVAINGLDVPRNVIFKSIYIEKTTLQAPVIVLYIHDPAGKMLDDYKAMYGATLTAVFGDPAGKGGTYQEQFFITSAPAAGDVVTVTGTTDDIYRLKTPSARSWLYTSRQPADVMNAHRGTAKVVSDIVKKPATYHLNAGEKPSKVLSMMAADRSALVWIAQGVFNFRTFDGLMKDSPAFEYEAYNPSAEYTISRLEYLNQDNAALESTRYHFTAWSPTDGYLTAGDPKYPTKHVSDTDRETLISRTRAMIPKMTIDVTGNPAIKAGLVIGVKVNRMDKDNQVSEVAPAKMIALRVAHVEQRESYMTRMILGVPN